jgi:hypothetical protein
LSEDVGDLPKPKAVKVGTKLALMRPDSAS